MKLKIDTSDVTFTVTKPAEPKLDQNRKPRADRNTGESLYDVQVMALDETGGEMLKITVAGQLPKVTVGQTVTPVDLEVIPWNTNDRHGKAYRAQELKSVPASAKAAA